MIILSKKISRERLVAYATQIRPLGARSQLAESWQDLIQVGRESMTDWKEIAGHLYDELRLRGADCLFNHASFCNCKVTNCIAEYELADERESSD